MTDRTRPPKDPAPDEPAGLWEAFLVELHHGLRTHRPPGRSQRTGARPRDAERRR